MVWWKVLLDAVSSLSLVKNAPQFGAGSDSALEVYAVPGLMTLLDVALRNAVEGEITGTVSTAHMLLGAWLDLKRQSIQVLQLLRQQHQTPTPTPQRQRVGDAAGNDALSPSPSSKQQYRRRQEIEGFARSCLDAACEAIERITTEKLASTANLSDPFDSLANNPLLSSSSSSAAGGSGGGGGSHYHHHHYHHHGSGSIADAFESSARDTGRRIPERQRPKGCWESVRACAGRRIFASSSDPLLIFFAVPYILTLLYYAVLILRFYFALSLLGAAEVALSGLRLGRRRGSVLPAAVAKPVQALVL